MVVLRELMIEPAMTDHVSIYSGFGRRRALKSDVATPASPFMPTSTRCCAIVRYLSSATTQSLAAYTSVHISYTKSSVKGDVSGQTCPDLSFLLPLLRKTPSFLRRYDHFTGTSHTFHMPLLELAFIGQTQILASSLY